jgi:hypothetical protein
MRVPSWVVAPPCRLQASAACSAGAHRACSQGRRRPARVRLVQANVCLRTVDRSGLGLCASHRGYRAALHMRRCWSTLDAAGLSHGSFAQPPRTGVPLVGVREARDRRVVPRSRARAVRGHPGRDRQQTVPAVARPARRVRLFVRRTASRMRPSHGPARSCRC